MLWRFFFFYFFFFFFAKHVNVGLLFEIENEHFWLDEPLSARHLLKEWHQQPTFLVRERFSSSLSTDSTWGGQLAVIEPVFGLDVLWTAKVLSRWKFTKPQVSLIYWQAWWLSQSCRFIPDRLWGTADAGIKVPSVQNPEQTNVLCLKPGVGQNIVRSVNLLQWVHIRRYCRLKYSMDLEQILLFIKSN